MPDLSRDHLRKLTGPHGLFEHAEHDRPRLEHGYTTDDNARALVVLANGLASDLVSESRPYLDFVVNGRVALGWHNRMSRHGKWLDRRGSDDAHGRALWGLGSMIDADAITQDGMAAFLAGLDLNSTHLMPNCYGVLGVARAIGSHTFPVEVEWAMEAFLNRVCPRLPRAKGRRWSWPEASLTYDNARLPHALLAAGAVLDNAPMIEHGLALLDWLIGVERGSEGWFSFTPVGGRGPGDPSPAFGQQPIEAWGMADACLAASRVDGSAHWSFGLQDAAYWFLGRNDMGVDLYEAATGAGFDGLEASGANLNRGAESTLSALGALQALASSQVEASV